jgi:hypothetical protein
MPNLKPILSIILWLAFFGVNHHHQVHAQSTIVWSTAQDEKTFTLEISGYSKCVLNDINKYTIGQAIDFNVTCGAKVYEITKDQFEGVWVYLDSSNYSLPQSFEFPKVQSEIKKPCRALVSSLLFLV